MKRDLGRLRVDNIIVHEVPSRPVRGGGDPLILSEIESPLTQELRNFFREKIAGSLATAAYDVVFDPDSGAPLPALIFDNLSNQLKGFVAMSQEMAAHLYNCQTGVNPSGLLILAQTSVETMRSLAILKLEKEIGARITPQRYEGKTTFDIERIQDLMLTGRTKVFKAGLFVQEGDTIETVEGAVSDKQRSRWSTTEVASFFLRDFLGCRPREAPGFTTKRFFEATEGFINGQVVDSATSARYQIALLATLGSYDTVIAPRAFAEEHLDLDDRQRFIDSLAEAGVPTEQFLKDTSLISSRLTRIQLDFEGGLAVLGTPEALEDKSHVTITSLDSARRTRVVIEDELKSVYGHR